ncbi:AAA family ATPase [Polyangium spumosum]|uniref:AAA family ATPase n=1 Tax=Polyangium spumosum TaxID=889282 RepID=UPI0019810E3A
MSLEAFGVKNLRCLTDTGLVPIRPITVLVGRNSSGKSTFLRAFPLLRQSVETPRNSPILWYHERFVDFGSLEIAANERLTEPSVTFEFRLKLASKKTEATGTIDIAVTLVGRDTPIISAYEFRSESMRWLWHLDDEGRVQGLAVNGKRVELQESLALGGTAFLLPTIQLGKPTAIRYLAMHESDDFEEFDSENAIKSIEDVARGGPPRVQMTNVVRHLENMIIKLQDEALAEYMHRVAYIAPLRVRAERAYRIQNLAVDEVDPDGKNLAMFLYSLMPEEVESLAAFTREALGFEARILRTGIHVEIQVKEQGAKRFVNLVDVGFGYSEVLPLMVALWSSYRRPENKKRRRASLLALEQPELHLHPAHQAKLARMLAETVIESRKTGPEARIMVETHSETLINGLGKLIYDGTLKPEDVQIVLFDLDEETRESVVKLAGYRENGALHDWPYGFLSPVGERLVHEQAAE